VTLNGDATVCVCCCGDDCLLTSGCDDGESGKSSYSSSGSTSSYSEEEPLDTVGFDIGIFSIPFVDFDVYGDATKPCLKITFFFECTDVLGVFWFVSGENPKITGDLDDDGLIILISGVGGDDGSIISGVGGDVGVCGDEGVCGDDGIIISGVGGDDGIIISGVSGDD
jgi:hypothetical protein